MEQGSVAQGFRGALLRRCWRPGAVPLVLLLSGRAPQAADPVQSRDKWRGPVPPAGEGCPARTWALLLLLAVLSPGVCSASLQNIQRSQETGTVTGGPADLAWGKQQPCSCSTGMAGHGCGRERAELLPWGPSHVISSSRSAEMPEHHFRSLKAIFREEKRSVSLAPAASAMIPPSWGRSRCSQQGRCLSQCSLPLRRNLLLPLLCVPAALCTPRDLCQRGG